MVAMSRASARPQPLSVRRRHCDCRSGVAASPRSGQPRPCDMSFCEGCDGWMMEFQCRILRILGNDSNSNMHYLAFFFKALVPGMPGNALECT